MAAYEYKVVPAPKRGVKSKGVKSTEDRFALALQDVMNPLGAQGWEYMRTDTLPCEERVGLTGRKTEFQNMLVFRRVLASVEAAPAPLVHIDPVIAHPDAPAQPLLAESPAEAGTPPQIATPDEEPAKTQGDSDGSRVAAA